MKGRARDSAVAEHRKGVVLFRILLVAVIVLAFVLRLRGIHWGLRVLPYFPYFLNYHPDEVGNTMQCISGMNPATMDFNPHYFVNPSLYYYVGGMALYLLSFLSSAVVSPFSPGKLSGDQLSTLFLMGRLVTVSVGVLSVYIVYEAARRLYSKPVGLLSALFLAITPMHVVHSHYFTVDMAGTFWVGLGILMAERVWRSGDRKWYLLAGLTIGLATATKYLGLLILFPVLVAYLLRWRASSVSEKGGVFNLMLLLGAVAVGFIIGCPYSLLSPGEFSEGIHGLVMFNQFPPSLFRLFTNFYYGLGPLMLIFAFLCVVLLMLARKPQDIIVLSFFLLFFLVSLCSASHIIRHVLPAAPALAIIMGRGVEIVWRRRPGPAWSPVVVLLCGIVIIYSAFYSWRYVTVMAGEDPRDECRRWMEAHLKPGEKVGLYSPPWFYTPPFDKKLYPAVLIYRDFDKLHKEAPEWYIITSFEYKWMTHINSGAGIYIREDFQLELARSRSMVDLDLPLAGYERVATFSRDVRPPYFGWCTARVPHDWDYPAPEIMLFMKKNGQATSLF